jgi:hypothetical protein
MRALGFLARGLVLGFGVLALASLAVSRRE